MIKLNLKMNKLNYKLSNYLIRYLKIHYKRIYVEFP